MIHSSLTAINSAYIPRYSLWRNNKLQMPNSSEWGRAQDGKRMTWIVGSGIGDWGLGTGEAEMGKRETLGFSL